MGRPVESPKKFIVSCRVDDTEMQVLKKLAEQADTNISGLLRRSLDLLAQTPESVTGSRA